MQPSYRHSATRILAGILSSLSSILEESNVVKWYQGPTWCHSVAWYYRKRPLIRYMHWIWWMASTKWKYMHINTIIKWLVTIWPFHRLLLHALCLSYIMSIMCRQSCHPKLTIHLRVLFPQSHPSAYQRKCQDRLLKWRYYILCCFTESWRAIPYLYRQGEIERLLYCTDDRDPVWSVKLGQLCLSQGRCRWMLSDTAVLKQRMLMMNLEARRSTPLWLKHLFADDSHTKLRQPQMQRTNIWKTAKKASVFHATTSRS